MEDKWKWISLSMTVCTFLFCGMIVVVNTNPFEFELIADDNAVDIARQFSDMSYNLNLAFEESEACKVKLEYYESFNYNPWNKTQEIGGIENG